MKLAAAHNFGAKQGNQLNQCRLYLQVTFISELCETSGHNIMEYFHEPTAFPLLTPTTYSTSKLRWPTQDNPPPKSWKTWRKLLALLTKSMKKSELKQRLGKWLTTFDKHRDWRYQYHSNIIQEMHQSHHNTWAFHDKHLRDHIFQVRSNQLPHNIPSITYVPVFPTINDHRLIITTQKRQSLDYDNDQVLPFPTEYSPLLPYYRIINTDAFAIVLQQPSVHIYVDGVTSLNRAAAGWLTGWLIACNNKIMFQGKVRIQHSSHNTPLRSASFGILAAIGHYQEIFYKYNCPQLEQQIEIYTNNTTLSKRLSRSKWQDTTASKQFEQEHESIQAIIAFLNDHKNYKVIYNSQNSKIPTEISINEQIKKCHQHAKNALSMFSDEVSLQSMITKSHLKINTIDTPTNLANEMRYAALSPDLRAFFIKKYQWQSKTIENIDWEVHSKAIQRQRPTARKTIIQFIHRWLPTHGHPGTKIDLTTKCPCCHQADETNDHFLQCYNKTITNEWDKQLGLFFEDMKKLQLDPILYYMIQALQYWRSTKHPDKPAFCKNQYKTFFYEQQAIGWNQVIMGRLSKSWVNIQNTYAPNQLLNGLSVITTAATKIFQIITAIWKTRCDLKYRTIDQPTYRNQILNPKIDQIYTASRC
jgi:hypothetical protein